MRRFIICRTFCERYRWEVEAKNEEEALKMLDDDEKTPSSHADIEWLGPFGSSDDCQEDEAIELIDE